MRLSLPHAKLPGMGLRVGLVGIAHVHADSYAHTFIDHPEVAVAGVYDHDVERGAAFAAKHQLSHWQGLDALLDACDAIAIASENRQHLALIKPALERGLHVICEKPLVTSLEEAAEMRALCSRSRSVVMTAFPCRFAPAYQSLKRRVQAGELGDLVGLVTTNRGSCPMGWFVEPEHSGGGAMIDHVVHVADLLGDLLGVPPTRVSAMTGNNMYSEAWEDTAMLTLDFPDGAFATLDSSWSRPKGFHTWGDVTLRVVGTKGVAEVDLFGPAIDWFRSSKKPNHVSVGLGSNLDREMIGEFVEAVLDGRQATPDWEAGIAASLVAIAGYQSAEARSAVPLPSA